MSLLAILIVVAVVCALFGSVAAGTRPTWASYWSWSPLGLVLLVLLILWLAGYVRP